MRPNNQVDYTKNPVWLIRGAGGGGSSGGTGGSVQIEPYDGSIRRPTSEKVGERPSVLDWGADRRGSRDTTPEMQAAIDAVYNAGGGNLYIPKGDYVVGSINLKENVTLVGEGPESKLFRSGDLPDGKGVVDINANNVGLVNLQIDGQVTTPMRLLYSELGTAQSTADPMHPLLTRNTSIWIHGGEHFRMENCVIQHTGGYGLLLDARGSDIKHVICERNLFENNRPHLFGVDRANIEYGSWTGGIHYQGDGMSHALFDAIFYANTFRRATGNCIWGHLYAFNKMHQNLRHIGNHFEDFGLDGILVGGVDGGVVTGNTFRRGGYIAYSDTGDSTPRYLNEKHSVGLDTAGLIRGVNYTANTFISMNGACMDLDGFSNGCVTGNFCWMPESGTDLYYQDRIGQTGPGGIGDNWTYGIQIANNYGGAEGAYRVEISGNTFRNMGGGALRICGRAVHIVGNNIDHPAVYNCEPVWLFNTGAEAYQRCYDNVIESNLFRWMIPGPMMHPCVLELDFTPAWKAGESNHVRNNRCIGNCYEMERKSSSESDADIILSSCDADLSSDSESYLRRVGPHNNGATRLMVEGVMIFEVLDNGLLNVSRNGLQQTGALCTGPRTTVAFWDVVATGKVVFDAFLAARNYSEGTFRDVDADLLDATWALLRFNKSLTAWEQSVSTSGGKRVWTAFSGGGSGTIGGIAAKDRVAYGVGSNQLGYNDSFAYNPATQQLSLAAKANDQIAVNVMQGSVWSHGGLATDSASANAIHAASGGILAKWLAATESLTIVGIASDPPAPDVNQGRIYYKNGYPTGTFMYWDHGAQKYLPFGGGGGSISGLTPPGVAYATSANTVGTDSHFVWYQPQQHLVVAGVPNTPAISATEGYIEAKGGFATESGSNNAVQALNGGIVAKWLITTNSIFASGLAAAPDAPEAGQGKFYYNSTNKQWEYWDEATQSWQSLRGFTGTFAAPQVIYAKGGSQLGGSARFLYHETPQQLWMEGKGDTLAALLIEKGYASSSGGFATTSTASTAVNALSGGMTAKWLAATESFTMSGLPAAPAPPSAGQGRIYYDSTGNGQFRYWDHATQQWRAFAAGGGAPVGPNGAVQLNNGGAFYGDGKLTFNGSELYIGVPSGSGEGAQIQLAGRTVDGATSLYLDSIGNPPYFRMFSGGSGNYAQLELFGRPDTAGLTVGNGWIYSGQGFTSNHNNYQTVNVGGGGVYARSLHAVYYTDIGTSSGAPGMTTGGSLRNGILYWDSALNSVRVYTPTGWQTLATGSGGVPGGPHGAVQINSSGVFAGYYDFMYNPDARRLFVTFPDQTLVETNQRLSALNIETGTGGTWRSISIHHRNRNANPIEIFEDFGGGYALVFNVNLDGSTTCNAGIHVTGQSPYGSNASFGVYTATRINFKQNAGDEANAGQIWYRGVHDPGALIIVGAGGAPRRIAIWDHVTINGGNESLVASGYIRAVGGLQTSAGSYQAIQTTNGGGVYARSLHAENYIDIGTSAGAPGMTAGAGLRAGVIFWDTNVSAIQCYTPSGWRTLGFGGSSVPGGPQWAVQRNNGGTFYGDNKLVYDGGQLFIGAQGTEGGEIHLGPGSNSTQYVLAIDSVGNGWPFYRMFSYGPNNYAAVQIYGQPGTWGLQVLNGYVESAIGFFCGFNEWNTIKIPSGGINARSGHFGVFTCVGQNFSWPSQTGSRGIDNGAIFYNTQDNNLYWLRAGNWALLTPGSTGVPDPLTLNNRITSNLSNQAAIYAPNGWMESKGFNVTGSASNNSIQTSGGIYSTNGYFGGSFQGGGVSCPNNGIGGSSFAVWTNGAWAYGYNSDVPAGRGLMVRGGLIISYY